MSFPRFLKTSPLKLFALQSEGLALRLMTEQDVHAVSQLANNHRIYEMTASLPHPYTAQHAKDWIAGQEPAMRRGERIDWAIVDSADGTLFGTCGFVVDARGNAAKLGYWVGEPFWGRGIGRRAARMAVQWALEHEVNTITANCFERNAASQKILLHCGLELIRTDEDFRRRDGMRDKMLYFQLCRN